MRNYILIVEDDNEIANYAAGMIYKLQTANIINGYEDGTFRPNEECTRAMAAKVISGILNYVK